LLELTLHPSKANDISKWRDLCKELPATLPTLAFKGTLVTDVKVKLYPCQCLNLLGAWINRSIELDEAKLYHHVKIT